MQVSPRARARCRHARDETRPRRNARRVRRAGPRHPCSARIRRPWSRGRLTRFTCAGLRLFADFSIYVERAFLGRARAHLLTTCRARASARYTMLLAAFRQSGGVRLYERLGFTPCSCTASRDGHGSVECSEGACRRRALNASARTPRARKFVRHWASAACLGGRSARSRADMSPAPPSAEASSDEPFTAGPIARVRGSPL